jgi:hypothetical protein
VAGCFVFVTVQLNSGAQASCLRFEQVFARIDGYCAKTMQAINPACKAGRMPTLPDSAEQLQYSEDRSATI